VLHCKPAALHLTVLWVKLLQDIPYDFFVTTRHLLMTAIVTTAVAVALH
jgi:hypothetical protein